MGRHHFAFIISVTASAAAVCAVVAARRHQLRPAATATAAQMGLTLVYWEAMVRYRDRHREGRAQRHW